MLYDCALCSGTTDSVDVFFKSIKALKMIILAKKIVKNIISKKYLLGYIYLKRKLNNELDAEMLYVSKILGRKRRFLDIGANIGIYSYHFKNSFEHIDAFEPLEELSHLKSDRNCSLSIHNVALSNKTGEVNLYIPYLNGLLDFGLASLEKRDAACEVRAVKVATLDSYNFHDVDLIKIDVEGHEKSVIEGALKIIKGSMPILIVEIEQRHITCHISDVFDYISSLNYDGFFLLNECLVPLTEFSYERYQKPFLKNLMVKEYINNFIFIPKKQ